MVCILKILYLINHAGKGGTERYVESLAEGMLRQGESAFFVYNEEGPLVVRMKELNVPVNRLQMKNPFDIKAALTLKKLCTELGIDIVHTHFLRENYISILSRILGNRVKLINTCHVMHTGGPAYAFANRFFTLADGAVIAVSGSVRDYLLRQGYSDKRIHVIYNGVDPEYWSQGEKNERSALSPEEIVIASAARFSEEKGHEFLLKVIRKIKDLASAGETSVRFRFILAGEGELLRSCRNLAGELGISEMVEFKGHMNDLRDLYHNTDMYICHSRDETLGISILEAMACGLPVVATEVGGIPEILINEQPCGILIKYGDIEGAARAVIKLAADAGLRREYGANAVKIVKERFTLEKMVRDTCGIYKELTDKQVKINCK